MRTLCTLLGWAIMGPRDGNIRSQFGKVEVNFLKYGNENDSVSWSREH